ncbi:E3 ubiquitin-protein ligase UHRF1 [Strongylocentrotus purpuratus]|uniref:YDG domain-containing protein n=1 Tax=Strongylocentrotus purpuratus TaxID=7668 RepID=A0A7M7LT61_STRPU|nr:E3 ubiquitin-protein ligase UHRF1 [Strongylocentrotus purpuratus]
MPGELSEYEKRRLKNIEENKRVLAGLGILKPFIAPKKTSGIKRKRPSTASPRTPKTPRLTDAGPDGGSDYSHFGRRQSRRLRGSQPIEGGDVDLEALEHSLDHQDADYKPVKRAPRDNTFGSIPGIEIGTTWEMRMECSRDGVHRPTVSGIHGNEDGCYSVALSGGYEDDVDMGECFTFTGQGGRDLKGTKNNPKNLRTAPQSKDQTLERGNLALSKNVEMGNPVRVIRGYKSPSPYAPEDGYRYDGLYSVEKFWFTTGLSGFGVYKFAFKRCPDQAPPPWEVDQDEEKREKEECSSDSGFTEHSEEVVEEDKSSETAEDISELSPASSPQSSH